MTQTLPQAMLQQAATRGTATALRYKRLGIWHPRSWQQLADEVGRLAAALQQSGFAREDELLIISQARAEALLLALAEAEAEVQQVREGQSPTRLLLFLDGRGLDAGTNPTLTAYEPWLAGAPAAAPAQVADSTRTAFVFYDADDQPPRRLSHGQLLEGARKLLARERLGPGEEALAARVFAASGQARYLLTPWLSAGFCLNFPEALATRDTDRRELGPTLVLGTRESYGRLELWARERLPLPGTLSHRLYHWAMALSGNGVRRWLGHWLIRRPLLDVLGMSRLRVPLLVGPALTPQSAEFFAALGVRPGNWQEPGSQHANADAPTRLLPQSV